MFGYNSFRFVPDFRRAALTLHASLPARPEFTPRRVEVRGEATKNKERVVPDFSLLFVSFRPGLSALAPRRRPKHWGQTHASRIPANLSKDDGQTSSGVCFCVRVCVCVVRVCECLCVLVSGVRVVCLCMRVRRGCIW